MADSLKNVPLCGAESAVLTFRITMFEVCIFLYVKQNLKSTTPYGNGDNVN